jgi:hypothetical protein
MKYVCLGCLEPRKFEKAGGGGLVRTGFSSLGRIVTFPAKWPLARLLPSGQCAQRPMFTELNISL